MARSSRSTIRTFPLTFPIVRVGEKRSEVQRVIPKGRIKTAARRKAGGRSVWGSWNLVLLTTSTNPGANPLDARTSNGKHSSTSTLRYMNGFEWAAKREREGGKRRIKRALWITAPMAVPQQTVRRLNTTTLGRSVIFSSLRQRLG